MSTITKRLMLGDCLERMKEIPDGSVDMVLTDPPYRVIGGGSGQSSAMHGPRTTNGILNKNDGKIFKHNDIEISAYAKDLYRVLANRTHCWMFCNEKNRREFEDEMLKAGFKCHGIFPWIKQNATPNRWGMKNWEPVFLFRKGQAKTLYTPSIKQAIFENNPVGKKFHPTEKPVALLQKYILASACEGQTVLDPFMGSGTTGVACVNTGRLFIGIELDEKYFDIAKERINEAVKSKKSRTV